MILRIHKSSAELIDATVHDCYRDMFGEDGVWNLDPHAELHVCRCDAQQVDTSS